VKKSIEELYPGGKARCWCCGKRKRLSNFIFRKDYQYRVIKMCKKCNIKKVIEWAENNLERLRKYRSTYYKKKIKLNA